MRRLLLRRQAARLVDLLDVVELAPHHPLELAGEVPVGRGVVDEPLADRRDLVPLVNQAKPEVVVLDPHDPAVLFEAADVFPGGLPHQDRRRAEGVPLPEGLEGDDVLGRGAGLVDDAVGVEERDIVRDPRDLPLELVREPGVVGIQESDPGDFASRMPLLRAAAGPPFGWRMTLGAALEGDGGRWRPWSRRRRR